MSTDKTGTEAFSEPFSMGTTDLGFLINRPKKISGGLILVCLRGHAEIAVDILHHKIASGNAVVLLPGTILSIHRPSPDLEIRYFYIGFAGFLEVTFKLPGDFFRFIKENPVLILDEGNLLFVKKWTELAELVMADRENTCREIMMSNLMQCLFCEGYEKMRRYFGRKSGKTKRQEEIFRDFMQLMKDHCRENRDVEFYARKLFITPRYLSYICTHNGNNLSAKKLIDLRTILEIKILLETTGDPVQKIAEQLNFPDQSYLGRFFKRYTGESPLAYRFRRTNG